MDNFNRQLQKHKGVESVKLKKIYLKELYFKKHSSVERTLKKFKISTVPLTNASIDNGLFKEQRKRRILVFFISD
jgi:hypothetical protein